MTKPFKTYNQQLKILRNRGLEIKNGSKAIKILKCENYYSIINGYKDIFLITNSNPEMYKSGTTFEDIYSLFDFDREIRVLFLKYILKIESLINTKISYFFSQKYNGDFSYLNINNFNPSKLEQITGLIANLSNVIKEKSKIKNKASKKIDNQISHYLSKHKTLPLWVLMRHLTFGITAYFYSSITDDLRIDIANEITDSYNKEYNSKIKNITSEHLENIIYFLSFFRNKCAHNERLFNLIKSKTTISYPHTTEIFNGKLFDLTIIFKLFLFKKDYRKFMADLKYYIFELQKELDGSIFNKVLIEMGFPKDWENRLK